MKPQCEEGFLLVTMMVCLLQYLLQWISLVLFLRDVHPCLSQPQCTSTDIFGKITGLPAGHP